jgi:hypothetical protein
MLERLDLVKLAPRRVLDAGSGPPQRILIKRYPGKLVIAWISRCQCCAPRASGGFRHGRYRFAPISSACRLPTTVSTLRGRT